MLVVWIIPLALLTEPKYINLSLTASPLLIPVSLNDNWIGGCFVVALSSILILINKYFLFRPPRRQGCVWELPSLRLLYFVVKS